MIGIRALLTRYMSGDELSSEDMRTLSESGALTPFERKVREHSIKATTVKEAPQVSDRHLRRGLRKVQIKDTEAPLHIKDWKPSSVLDHSKEFVAWINSMLYGSFKHATYYKPFENYKKQCDQWLADTSTIGDFETYEERMDWACKEWDRCRDNSLFACCKYGYLHEGSDDSGRRKFVPYEHQKVLLYLLDCGYSYMLGKGRQIGSTSVIGLAACLKIIFNRNYYIKFITEDEKTGEEIFTDKIKYPFNELPSIFKVTPKSDSAKRFWLSSKAAKGSRGYPNSRIEMIPPSATAINGGSPQLTLIDEIGTIPVLGDMMREGRPTLYWKNPDTGAFELRRQILLWGCVCAGTKVWTADGRLVNVENLRQEDGIIGYDGAGASKENIAWMQPPAEKPCYRITTIGGYNIECSEDHPILTSRNKFDKRISGEKVKNVIFKRADSVAIGDQVMILDSMPIFGTKSMWNPRLVGLLIGDGCIAGNCAVQIGGQDSDIHNYLESNFNVYERKDKTYITNDGHTYKLYGMRDVYPHLKELGIYGQSKQRKTLPNDIYEYDKESICELIGGLIDADGNVKYYAKTGTVTIILTTVCKHISEEVRTLLQKLGIHGHICKEIKHTNLDNVPRETICWNLYISDNLSVRRFKDNIKLLVSHKQANLDKVSIKPCKKLSSRYNYIDSDAVDTPYAGSDNMSGLRYAKVISVDYIGYKPIYNLTAGNTHTYVANGIVTHNTAGKMDKGKGDYQKEWANILSLWEDGDYSHGIIPVFFDYSTRVTEEEYQAQKKFYYGGKRAQDLGIDLETSKIQFHQHYPTRWEDMFVTTLNTLVGRDVISAGMEACRNLSEEERAVWGYMEPTYDMSQPTSHGDVPYKIIGARFVPVEEEERVAKATVLILTPPEMGWRDRYYKGTDPISAATGKSKFSSTVYDALTDRPVALHNSRTNQNPKYDFLQSMLLNLYYGQASNAFKGIPELVESNIGQGYMDYVQDKGFDYFVYNAELPLLFQGGTHIGIDNKSGSRNPNIISAMQTYFRTFASNILMELYWIQLETFVQEIGNNGASVWGPQNKKAHWDDTLFGLVYSRICRISYPERTPSEVKYESSRRVTKYKIMRTSDMSQVRVPVKEMRNI